MTGIEIEKLACVAARAPVFSCAHYFQAPATQAIEKLEKDIYITNEFQIYYMSN